MKKDKKPKKEKQKNLDMDKVLKDIDKTIDKAMKDVEDIAK